MDSNQDFGSILNSFSGSGPSRPKQDSGDEFGSVLNSSTAPRQQPARSIVTESSAGSSVDSFVKSVEPAARRVAQRLNVPVEAIIGQWGLETGWGKSVIPGTNNLGNIKDFSGNGVAATDNQTGGRDRYRAYQSVDQFADDFTNLVSGGRYKNVSGSADAQSYFRNLQSGGYAEDRNYVESGTRAAQMAAKVLNASGDPAAQPAEQSTAPRLRQAPKWAEITSKPGYASLSPEQKAEAKAAYFDYWIAPHAGQNRDSLRDQFLSKPESQPGLLDHPSPDGALPPEASTGSSLRGVINSLTRDEESKKWDMATAEQRKEMEAQPGWRGILARERAAMFAQVDKAAKKGAPLDNLRRQFDPRIEVQRDRRTDIKSPRQLLHPQFSDEFQQERTFGEVAGDTGVQLAEGANTILGAIPSLVAPESGVAQFFDDNAQFWRDKQSDVLKNRIKKADEYISEAGQDGLISQIVEASSVYFSDPGLAARFVTTNLPSMIPGIGAAKVAQASALARGASAARAAQIATTVSGGTNAVLNAGGARSDAFQDIKATLIAQGMSPQEAEQRAIEDSRVVAAVGAATGYYSGKIGLEKALVSAPGRGGIGAGVGAFAKEMLGEQLEEVGPKVTTNAQAGKYDNRPLSKDVGRTVVETAIGSAPGGVVAGGIEGYNTPEREIAREINRNARNATFTNVDEAARNALNPNPGGIDPRLTVRQEPEVGPPSPIARDPGASAPPLVEPTLTQDGRIEPTLGGVPAATPAETAGAPSVHPMVTQADNIVRELAQKAGIPESTVLPAPAPDVPLTDEGNISDQDVTNFAASRYQQLREKRDGTRQTVMGDSGPVDQDVPGVGLSAAEQKELNGLENARGDLTALRKLYGFDQTQPMAVESSAAPPGLAPAQENQNAQEQTQAVGPAPGPNAIDVDGLPSGPAAEQGSAEQAPAAQGSPETSQRYEGLPAEGSVTVPLSERSEAELRQQLRNANDRGIQRQIAEELQRRKADTTASPPAAPKTEKEARAQKDYSEKWFGSADKAQAFIEKQGIGATHEVAQNGKQFIIQKKEAANGTQAPETQQAEAQGSAQERGTERQVGSEPSFWTSKTPAERKWMLNASGLGKYTALTQWSRISAEDQAALIKQWGDKSPATDAKPKTEKEPPGTRYNTDADRKAADRLQALLDSFNAERNTRSGQARSNIRSVIDELRKPGTVVSVEAILEDASTALMKNFPAQAQVVDEVINQIAGRTTTKPEPQTEKDAKAQRDATTSRLMEHAKRLRIHVNETTGHIFARGGMIDIPAEDREVDGALSRNHVIAHELGHAVMQKRQISYAGFPVAELRKWIKNFDELVSASKAYRPAIWGHENKRIAAYARKPDEIIADAIGSVLLGQNDFSLLRDLPIQKHELGFPVERTATDEVIEQAAQRTAPTEQPASADQFANNKLFTADKVEAARARMKAKLGRLNSGIDPELMIDGVTIAGAYIESGVRSFSAYSKAMIGDFGEKIRPYLRSFYEGVRHYPGLDTKGMTTPAEIDMMEKQGTAEHTKPAPGADEALGETVSAPKRTKERKASESTLRDDYGVSNIDGYDSTDERPSGPVKTQFLADTRKYLSDVAAALQAKGFAPQSDSKGKPMKPVNVNESGVAGSGDVSLAMFHPDMQRGIYITIGGTSLRGAVPSTKSGVNVMMRVTKASDPYGGDQNRWMPVTLSSTELADLAATEVEKVATRDTQSTIAKPAAQAQTEQTKETNDGDTRRSDSGDRDGSVARTESIGPAAASDQRTSVDLAGREPNQAQGTGEGKQASATSQESENPAANGQRVPVGLPDGARKPDGKASDGRTAADTVASNFTITDELNFAGQGAKTKYKNNVAAIRLLKQLESEGRQATGAEQAILAKYIGWGGMPQAFDSKNEKWSNEFAELKELLTAEEYSTAVSSTRNAHYTAAPVVQAIWTGVQRIGFKNGSVLEPSVGSGNFFGLMPVADRAKSRLFGVEFDHLTGGIAKQLYPQAKINAPIGFQDIRLAPESFDLAIGNPPFGSEQLYDKNNPEASKFKIHGFFFAKSVETLKPGGVLAMVVSKGLMDANDSLGKAARAWLADRTRLLGAIRLPNSAFQENANTEVTTDIIFLQKLSSEVKPNTDTWNAMSEIKDRATGEPIAINKYFAANPDMMLGEMTLAGSMYRANEPTLSAREGDNLPDLLAKAIEKLPQGVFKTGSTGFVDAAEKANKVTTASDVREYGHFIKDGKLYQRMPDHNGERQSVPVAREGKELERMVGMVGLRDAVRKQLELEKSATSTNAAIEANRAALNKAYDDFVKKYGYLNAQTNKRLFSDDSDAALLLSLEGKWDKGVTEAVAKTTGQKPRQAKATKATIFSKRVQTPVAAVTKANTAKEAMLASLNERGRIDGEFMSGLYGKSFDEIVSELSDLVFEEPGYGWVPADLYLSGNVKAALAVAKKAAEVDARFERNVVALMKVQPADINPSDIFVKIGSPWVALDDYAAFVKETFGGNISGAFLPSLGNWSVDVVAGTPTETTTTWGTERMGANRIIETLMGNKQVAVYDEYKDADGNTKRVLNADETAAAQGKADALAEAFQDWIWKDNERRDRLARSYNDTYNTNIPREYDGSHLTLPGMNPSIALRPHQLNWVYRSLVEGKGLADHVVGAGKTFAMIASMMEMRRLGLANKPMIVVPNHLVGQWAKDILALYPGANVLAASRNDFTKDRRKLLFSRIATGDWDMVVVAHSSFGRIPMPAETEQKILDEQMKELTDAIKEARLEKGKRTTVKDLEKAKVRIEEKLKKLADRKQDDALDFADLGVDALAVDEAHEFKNLFYTTTLQGVAGLGSPQGSTRAFDMFIKTRYVSERAGGKNVFFATGTPVANSIAEVFHMQRFLQYDTLKARGIHNFDAWANTFGQSTSDWEMNAAGKFVQKTRFRKFANLPELKGIWGEVADTVTRADLIADAEKQSKRFPLPKVNTGKPQNIVTERSDWQAEFIGVPQQEMDDNGKPKLDDNGQPIMKFKSGTIVYRLENWKEASKKNPKEIPLAITGQARKAGLDYRLIDESAPDFEGSKINAAVSRIYDTWKANDYRKGTQLVFCDLSVPASAKGQATAEAAAKSPTFFIKDGDALRHVAGKLLTLAAMPDVEVFSFKDGKRWVITERTTGLKFSEGSTKQEAIDAANARAARVDPKWMQEQISNKAIPQEAIDDYIARWEEQQAKSEDTGSDEDSAEGAKEISLDEMLADGGGTFSVYDDIKAKLIEKGMPPEQIAFIHDYGTDDKKAALFAGVNSGEIRVLLGSTQKMGAGTNVQSKLVALHHMDAPWRPSDLEQREGRIIRQGNEFYEADPDGFAVDIYRYATKQTYDSRMWEIIETKARAIEQFKSDSSMREIEDVSSESANAAEIKAGASGNPLILDAITLAADLRKLQAMKKSWDRSRFDLEKKIQQAANKTGWVYNGAQMAEEFAATVEPKNKDKLGLNVFGLTINSEKDVTSEALASKMIAAATDTSGKKVGQYRGVDLYVRRDSAGVTFFTSFRDHSVSSTIYGPQDKFSAPGFLTRMDNLVDGAAKWKTQTALAVVQFEKDAENAKKELSRGFPKEDELKTTNEKHKAVVAALRAGKTSLEDDAASPNTILKDLKRSPSPAFSDKPDAVRADALAKLKALEKKAEAGKITDAEYRLGVQELIAKMTERNEEREYRRVVTGRKRGADWIVAKMRTAVTQGTVTKEATDFAQWLLDQNPNVADDLGISVRTPKNNNAAGEYNSLNKVFTLVAGQMTDTTAVHEILHHTERMMPQEVQDGILREWQRAWDATYKKGDPKLKEAMQNMLKSAFGDTSAEQRVSQAFKDRTITYDDHYQLYSPSEFWAVNATRILSGRYAAKGSWVKTAVQWFKEFVQRIKGAFGLRSDAPIIKALNGVMTTDGTVLSSGMLLEKDYSAWMTQNGVNPKTPQQPVVVPDFVRNIQNNAIQFFGNRNGESLKTFGLYDKTLSTQYNKALKDKHFGKVFGLVNAMQNEVSLTSIRPAELAPGILARVDDVKSAAKQLFKGKKADAQLSQAAGAIFAGTLDGANVMEGRVWTEDELRSKFGMDDTGVALYQQTRAAIDASLDELAASEAYAMAQTLLPKTMRRQIIENPQQAEEMVVGEIKKQIKTIDTAIRAANRMGNDQHESELRAAKKSYTDALRQVEKIFVTSKNLKAAGYAPLMRFGKFTVAVQKIDTDTGRIARDENGESMTEFYGQYETEGEAKMVLRQMQEQYADREDVRVTAGTKSQTSHELYAGISPETLALFAEVIGADSAMKKYIELAMTERSALKRRLERKGTAGYSEDLPRVLSNFITSNGRFAAQRYYLRDLNNSIKYIPKEKGDVLDEAMALKKFVMNPQDSGAVASSVMFTWFLGGSVASAMVNLTQPVMMTAPYLSQFGMSTATKALATAMPMALGKKQITDTALRDALKRASQEGIVDAQEIFHLYSVGAQGAATALVNTLSRLPGVGGKIKQGSESARARITAFGTLWGSMFSLAEGFNRKLTFIAAWEVAKANGEKNPYAFAVRAVNETQGIYNKVNRPNWARGTVGRTVLTFKQFSLMYLELLNRMWRHGGPEGKRAALIMLAVLMLAAGSDGLPFAQDLDDLIDTVGQLFGLDTNMKRNKRRLAHEILGKSLGDMFLYGVSSELPLDFSGRLGLGNLIPGSAALKPSAEASKVREVTEVFGPAAGLLTQIGDAYDAAAEGNWGKAGQNLAPMAVKNLLAGVEMAKKGYATDVKGRKVTETTNTDAAFKAIGFNPTAVAQETRKTMPVQQDIALQKKTEASIVDQWAQARVDNNEAGMAAAIKRLDDWNKTNPDTPIKINSDQLRNKARQLATDKDHRLLKSTPRELRGRIGLDLAD